MTEERDRRKVCPLQWHQPVYKFRRRQGSRLLGPCSVAAPTYFILLPILHFFHRPSPWRDAGQILVSAVRFPRTRQHCQPTDNPGGWETRDGEKTLNLAPFERVFTVQILRQISTLCARIATRPDAMNSRGDHRFESMRQYLLSSDFFETNSLHESIANLSTYNLIKNDILVE